MECDGTLKGTLKTAKHFNQLAIVPIIRPFVVRPFTRVIQKDTKM